jgi:hypothetical protein
LVPGVFYALSPDASLIELVGKGLDSAGEKLSDSGEDGPKVDFVDLALEPL